jgi:hypothetical protein
MPHDVPSLEIDDLRGVLIRSGNSYVEYTRDRAPMAALRQKRPLAQEYAHLPMRIVIEGTAMVCGRELVIPE